MIIQQFISSITERRPNSTVITRCRKKMLKSHTVVLGTVYNKDEECTPTKSSGKQNNDYRRHVRSLFRFTYRKDFPAFDPYKITSDAGWGCMLRVSQMLMATAYQRHLCGKEWRRGLSSDIASLRANSTYCNILRWFMDYPGPPHIYAIHHLVQVSLTLFVSLLTSPSGWYLVLLIIYPLPCLIGSLYRPSQSSFLALLILHINTSFSYLTTRHDPSYCRIVQCGIKYDKLPGEWFGPSTAALVLR